MSALLLLPFTKKTIWGGHKLKNEFNIQSDLDSIAEAWSLSCHKDGLSIVKGGKYNGKSLNDVIKAEGKQILGTHCEDCDDFPILIKLIDAADKLSVQVHPDDEYAAANETDKRGKTEAWYIIDTEKDAELIFGFKDTLTKEEFRKSIEDDTILDHVNTVKVKSGDVAFIKSKTLHAIGAGILLAEVQQSCNTTYRVYDYNRPDTNGKPRELHINKAVDVTSCTPPDVTLDPIGKKEQFKGYNITLLSKCEYFTMSSVEVTEKFEDIADETSFVSLLILDGKAEIEVADEKLTIKKGDSIFIPANDGKFTINGNTKILLTRV